MIKKSKNILSSFEEILVSIMMVIIISITFGNVISRKFLMLSWAFTEEITVNLLVWIVFLGASIAAKRQAHIGLTLLTDAFPQKIQKVVETIVILIVVVFFSIVFYQGVMSVIVQAELKQMTAALGWPQWMFSLSVPVGSLLLIIRFVGVYLDRNLKARIKT